MKLEEIIPQETSFFLESTGNTYYLRKFSLSDEIWLKNNFADRILEIFNPECPDFDAICRIIYNQIIDRDDFAVQNAKIIDENGEKSIKRIGGYKLLAEMVYGLDEKLTVMNCLNRCMGFARPIADEESKKKV